MLASAIAAATTRLRIALAAVIAPLRHPLLLAKQLATLDLLSEGRLVVQPTVSWHEQEYEALGVPFHQRGAILDEQLEAMAAAWRDTPAALRGAALPLRRRLRGAQALPARRARACGSAASRCTPRCCAASSATATASTRSARRRPTTSQRLRAAMADGRPRRRRARAGRRHPRPFADETSVADLAEAAEAIPGQLAARLHLDLLQAVDVHGRHRAGRAALPRSGGPRRRPLRTPSDARRGAPRLQAGDGISPLRVTRFLHCSRSAESIARA